MFLHKLSAFLLIPCLIADPVLASALPIKTPINAGLLAQDALAASAAGLIQPILKQGRITLIQSRPGWGRFTLAGASWSFLFPFAAQAREIPEFLQQITRGIVQSPLFWSGTGLILLSVAVRHYIKRFPHNPSRRATLLEVAAAAGAIASFLYAGFLPRGRPSTPAERMSAQEWRWLHPAPVAGQVPLPYWPAMEYVHTRIHGVSALFQADGTRLGGWSNAVRFVALDSNETLGYSSSFITRIEPGDDLFTLMHDRFGAEMMHCTFRVFRYDGDAIPGVPSEFLQRHDARQAAFDRGIPQPFFQVMKTSERGMDPARMRLAGYLQKGPHGTGILLDADRRPIARVEPARLLTSEYVEANGGVFVSKPIALLRGDSLTGRFFNQPPTREIEQELERFIRAWPAAARDPLHPEIRFELIHRLTQIRIMLGMQSLPPLDPTRARAVAAELNRFRPVELDRLDRPTMRRLLWESLAEAHPMFAIAREAARSENQLDDPVVLRFVIAQFQLYLNVSAAHNDRHPVDDATRKILLRLLRFNGIRDRAEAADYYRQIDVRRDAPEWKGTFMGHRLSDDVQMQGQTRSWWLIGHAVSLARAGLKTELIFPASSEQLIDANTKTITDPLPMVCVRDPDGSAWLLGSRQQLAPFGPVDQDGWAAVTDFNQLRAATASAAIYPISESMGWPRDIPTYLRQAAEWLTDRHIPVDPGDMLIMGTIRGDLGQSSTLTQPIMRTFHDQFEKIVRERRIRIDVGGIFYLILDRYRQAFTQAALRVPRAFLDVIVGITFIGSGVEREGAYVTTESGKQVWKSKPVPVLGIFHEMSNVGTIEMGGSMLTAIHEIYHAAGILLFKQPGPNGRPLIDLFNDISWQYQSQNDPWIRRPTSAENGEHFLNDGSIFDQREDFATTGERYVLGQEMRETARRLMRKGDLALAAKHLFMKYVANLDWDGRTLEHAITTDFPALTFDEVLAEIDRTRGLPMTKRQREEFERLIKIIEEIRSAYNERRRSLQGNLHSPTNRRALLFPAASPSIRHAA